MIRARRARTVLGATLCMLAGTHAAARAQEPAQTERVRVRLVQRTLLALDRQDRPVTDLAAEEIVVKERGRKVPVAFLEPFTRRSAGPLPAIRLRLEVPGGSADQALPQQGEPRYVIVLVDAEQGYRLRRDEAAEQLIGLVDGELDARTRLAVFAYDGELHLEQSFTSDPAALSQAIARAFGRRPGPGLDLSARMRDLMRRLGSCRAGHESCLRGVAQEYADEVRPRAEGFLAALEDVTAFANGLPRRVAVVALTHGVASDPGIELREATRAVFGEGDEVAAVQMAVGFGDGAQRQRDALVATALARGVTLHFIDRQPAPTGDFNARLGGPMEMGARPLQVAHDAAQADLAMLARQTGGVLVTSSDAGTAMRRVLEAERGAYLLGYYPDDAAPPARKLRITTKRKGVRLLEGSPHGPSNEGARRLPLELSVGVGVPLADEQPSGEFVPFSLVLDPTNLHYAVGEDEAATDFTVHVRVETAAGLGLGEAFHFVRHAYPRETWDRGAVEPLRIEGWTELPPGDYRIVAYVRDPQAGRSAEIGRKIHVGRE